MKNFFYSGMASIFFLLALATQSAAIQIGAGAFGPGAVVESFEGLAVGPNITSAGGGYLEPGVNGPFTFSTGVTFSNPVPNPGIQDGVIIGDFAIGAATFGLGGNGGISSASDVPFGSAYMGLDDPATSGPIEFSFQTDMLRAGAYITGVVGTITISAYDAGGSLLETQTIASVNVSAWGSNFLGIENSSGIRRITFGGDFEVLDGLMFEASGNIPAAIPTLSEWGMILFSLLLAGCAIVFLRKQPNIRGLV